MATLHQLNQCLVTEVLNPDSNLKEVPVGVVLISTYDIPDKDTADAGRHLAELKRKGVKFVTTDSFIELIRQHLDAPPPTFKSLKAGVPKKVERVVRATLEKTAARRPPTRRRGSPSR